MNRGGITGVEIAAAAVVLALMLAVCLFLLQKNHAERELDEAGRLVWDCLLTERLDGVDGIGGYWSGRANDGVGIVLVSHPGTFWVHDGTVYVVDEPAHALLPAHRQAPPEVSAEALRKRAAKEM